ncbi:hypothetical protein SAMN05421788_10966 [Filimonas lacunae]|uniref:Uncharacterized protein n=1 Tax=Filimonas lacunae TaxID=477680 RepID=A0A1N7R405_9BACT|nr:hypothetical protein [Filimonas lacunae]SIT29878.1 hypothetical protein SAMN05421788_10966 [Filimonas lacunae]
MKKIYLLLAVALLCLVISAATFVHFSASYSSTSSSYTANATAVTIKATYNPEQAPLVEKYVDSCLQPVVVFGTAHKVNKDIAINESQLLYHVKASPGTLTITASPKENDRHSLDKLRNILDGLGSVIKPY